MDPHCLGRCLTQLLPVQLGCSAVVLLLCVRGQAVVATEEGAGLSIPTKLHLPQLLPAPVGVQVGGADEGQVDTQRPGQEEDACVIKGNTLFSLTYEFHYNQCR